MTSDAHIDAMRRALADCTFLPGSPPKRFARQVAAAPLEKLTEGQRVHIVRLCWRYRRQMPRDLVPSKDAVDALDADWNARRAAAAAAKPRRMTRQQREAAAQPVLAI